MKLIKFEKAEKFKNGENCEVLEYPLNDIDINISTAVLSGRYPEKGYCVNEECKELNYLLNYRKTTVKHIITPKFKIINKNKLEFEDCFTENYYYIIRKEEKNIEMVSFEYAKNGHYFMETNEIPITPTSQEEITELTKTRLDKIKNKIRTRKR